MIGSPDLYSIGNRPAGESLNFITCQDGFALNDLVSYDSKHNEADLESNHDGASTNLSWNCGVEGASSHATVEDLRMRQIKNMLALTLLSVGTPMLLMGDEIRRSQRGNNNAYCQDNEFSWMDWSLCATNSDLLRFVRLMTRLRLRFNGGFEPGPLSLGEFLSKAQIEWHGTQLGKPDWGRDSHCIALTLHNAALRQMRYVAINAYWETLEFELPSVEVIATGGWLRIIDTSLPSPNDIVEEGCGSPVSGRSYAVKPRSLVLLHAS